jgi:hypothetical protein
MDKARRVIAGGVTIDADTGCWMWNGNPRENGYCRTTYKRKNWYLHRLSYAAFVGEIPDGMDVCHRCDVRGCCNPAHLFVGTRLDNVRDAVSKGRHAHGKSLPQAKLSESDISSIVERAAAGEKYGSIARDFSICRQHAGHLAIKNGVRRNGK